jgi:hypothetical protein
LYCFKELIYNEVGYQRNLDQGDLVNREILGEFREILFRKFALPRRRTVEDRKEEADAIASLSDAEKKEDGIDVESIIPSETKIIFYDNKLSQQTKWNEMESLITKARSLEKYSNIKFVTVDDFSTLTVAQQARTFNEADAVIMVHGEHMANAIFAVVSYIFLTYCMFFSRIKYNIAFLLLIRKCTGWYNLCRSRMQSPILDWQC